MFASCRHVKVKTCTLTFSNRALIAGNRRTLRAAARKERGQKYYENFLANREKRGGRYIDTPLDEGLVGDPKLLDALVDQLLTAAYQVPLVHYNGPVQILDPKGVRVLVSKDDRSQHAGIQPLTNRRREAGQATVAAGSGQSDEESERSAAAARKGITIGPPEIQPVARQYPLPALPPRQPLATAAQLYVFWNLDNKHPGGIDPRALVANLRSALSYYGAVQGIYAYAGKKTWSPVPPALLEKFGRRSGTARTAQGMYRCPICQLELPSFDKLRTHTKTLHGQDLLQRSILTKALTSAAKNTSLGNVSHYYNSAGQAFEPQYGLMMSLKYVLLREGVDVRVVNSADRDVTAAINKGIGGLVEKLAAGAAQPGQQQVVVLISDDDSHAPLLRRCRGLGLSTMVACQDVLVRRGADITLRWPWLRSGTYCAPES